MELIALTLLQLADIYTTLRILDKGGRELNPFLAYLFSVVEPLYALLVVKTIFLGLAYLYAPEWLVWVFVAWLCLSTPLFLPTSVSSIIRRGTASICQYCYQPAAHVV